MLENAEMTQNNRPTMNSMTAGANIRPPRPPVQATTMSPKEIVDILRRHVWLIILMSIVGIILATIAYGLMRIYAPKYTAMTFIEVLEPGKRDPSKFATTMAGKDIAHQQANAD